MTHPLLFAMIIGYFVFAERPDLWVWVGTLVIVASGIYTLTRERRARQVAVGRN